MVGATVPDSTVKSLKGNDKSLKKILMGKKSVLIFYRGDWCPYCNTHLADLAKVEGDLRKQGFQIIAISPDSPTELRKTHDRNHLTYKLYSDSTAEAMKSFGVAYRLDDPTFNMMSSKYNVNLERSSGHAHHILPVPSVFIINTNGKIVYVHTDPNYKVRLKGAELMEAVAKLK